jgi:trk system potassium uptake protein
MKRVVVVGLGNFGSAVADTLAGKGHDVIAIDRDPAAVDRIGHRVSRAVVADGTDGSVLREVGCDRADVAIIGTGDDITASVLAALALQDLKIPELYVKVISEPHARAMEKLGVTGTVFPERDTGRRLGESVASKAVLNYVPLSPGFSLQEMAVPDAWVGRSLRELDLRKRYRVSVAAVHDMLMDEVTGVPDPDAPLKESDTLFVAGSVKDLEEFTCQKSSSARRAHLPEELTCQKSSPARGTGSFGAGPRPASERLPPEASSTAGGRRRGPRG